MVHILEKGKKKNFLKIQWDDKQETAHRVDEKHKTTKYDVWSPLPQKRRGKGERKRSQAWSRILFESNPHSDLHFSPLSAAFC